MFTEQVISSRMAKDLKAIRGDYQTKVVKERWDNRKKSNRSVVADILLPALAMTIFNPLFWIGFFLFYRW